MEEIRILEFKQDLTNTFLKTVSAFANYDGGTIIFGVDDDGKSVGLENQKQACLDIENKINDSIHPQPNYTLEVRNEDKIVVLKVNQGKSKSLSMNAFSVFLAIGGFSRKNHSRIFGH